VLDQERIEKDQQTTRINRDLSDALGEAAVLREKLTARPGGQGPWNQLRETIRRAETLAENELADPVLVGRVRNLSSEIKQVEADRRMVVRLEEIRLERGMELRGSSLLRGSSIPAYTQAFKDYGIPIFDLDVEEAARRIAASPIRDWLIVALDDCAGDSGDVFKHVLPIARRAEKDPWRQQYFAAHPTNACLDSWIARIFNL
jgi:hypothetical protein